MTTSVEIAVLLNIPINVSPYELVTYAGNTQEEMYLFNVDLSFIDIIIRDGETGQEVDLHGANFTVAINLNHYYQVAPTKQSLTNHIK
jgi:hypothetical protein